VGHERAHAEFLGQGQSLLVVGFGLCDIGGIAMCGNLTKEPEGPCLVSPLLAGKGEFEPGAFQTTDFTVQDVRFAAADDVSLAAAEGHYNGGGPLVTLYLRHDSGSVSRYSWMFLIGSTVGLLIHLPLLDRAERRRKDILTGGTSPPWYGPA